jgi:hypothetical protein
LNNFDGFNGFYDFYAFYAFYGFYDFYAFYGFYEWTNYRVFSSTNLLISWTGLGRTKGKQNMELAQLQAVSAALIIK